jgi:excisionase family DNA binding protein
MKQKNENETQRLLRSIERKIEGKQKNETQRLLYSRAAAAELLSISISTLDIAILRGLLPARKIGRKVLVPHASLMAFSKKNLPLIWPEKINGKTVRGGHAVAAQATKTA